MTVKRLILLFLFLFILMFPEMTLAQSPDDPPDSDIPPQPPGLEWTQAGTEESGIQSDDQLEEFIPYAAPEALDHFDNAVLAINRSSSQYPFFIRSCPTRLPLCGPGVRNKLLGKWEKGDVQWVDFTTCVASQKWRWCYMPYFDPDPYDEDLKGWVAVKWLGVEQRDWIVQY